MLGIEDKSVILAYLLCIISALLCIVYGIITWNKGDDSIESEDIHWVEEEKKVDEDF